MSIEGTTLPSPLSSEECDLRQFIANLILKTNERIDKVETNLKDYLSEECAKLQNSIDKNTARPFYRNVNHLAKILNTRDCKNIFFLLSRNLDEFKVDEFWPERPFFGYRL